MFGRDHKRDLGQLDRTLVSNYHLILKSSQRAVYLMARLRQNLYI